MPSEKKYPFWPALLIVCLAFLAPVTIGIFEVRVARNSHAESAAIDHLQAIARAEDSLRQVTGQYSAALDAVKDLPAAEPYYSYDYRQLSPSTYVATATPHEPGKHGKRFFYVDQSGVVRYEVLHPASATSPVVPPIK
jgi:hypothetical protein